MDAMTAKKCGKVLGPTSKFGSRHAERIMLGIIQNAKDLVSQSVRHRPGHACETLHEEIDRVPLIMVERSTSSMSSVSPRVVMIQHVDKHDAQ
jgi:hypothetical protein